MWGRIDTEGHLIGRYQQTLTPNMILRLGAQVSYLKLL